MPSSEIISARTRRFVEATLGADPHLAREHLATQRVSIALEAAFAKRYTGQAILFTLLNLLVRLEAYCPILAVAVPDVPRHPLLRLLPEGGIQGALRQFFGGFPAAARLTFVAAGATKADVVVTPDYQRSGMSLWADGWLVYLNEPALGQNTDVNPVGAHVAAALGAAEILKRLLAGLTLPPGLRIVPVERLIFSTYDYTLGGSLNPPLPPAVDVDGVVVVGLGGIGSAFAAAASNLPALSGRLTLVDRDALDGTSFNRHLVAVPGDTGAKVDLCRRALAFHPDVDARAEWFDEFDQATGDPLDLVVVGVDKDPVRRAIQAKLPRVILNGGTSDTASFRVSRHDYRHGACLSCIAREDLQDHPTERALARQLGLDLATVLEYQRSGDAVHRELLERAGVLSKDDIEVLAGRPLAEIQRRICAELRLGPGPEGEAVSISFLSALPGFLLLGEIIKERAFAVPSRPPINQEFNHMLLSVIGRPHPSLLHGWMGRRPDCGCGRAAYQRAYARKWPSGAKTNGYT